jgi:ABC-type lipoprotein export system ATPase subunit
MTEPVAAREAAAGRLSSAEREPVVHLRGLTKEYPSDAGPVPVLRGIDLTAAAGETIVVKGVSGSGKSTLLHVLGAIDKPSGGTARVCGEDLSALSRRAQTAFRAANVGLVFQFFNLIPTLTATENVVAALDPLGGRRKAREADARRALDAVGLADQTDKYPSHLSGGQQQRVAIARALVKRPALILADEPTGALDSTTAHQVLRCLKDVQAETECTMVIATHDPIVGEYADRIFRIDSGRIEEQG